MTREQVLGLRPGREMDAMVAEKAMGWTNIITKDEYGGVYVGRPPDRRFWDTPQGDYIPRYSTDVAAAWQVIERLGEREYTTHIEWKGSDRVYAGTAEVVIVKGSYAVGHGVGMLPEAVCKAALLALLEEAKDI